MFNVDRGERCWAFGIANYLQALREDELIH